MNAKEKARAKVTRAKDDENNVIISQKQENCNVMGNGGVEEP